MSRREDVTIGEAASHDNDVTASSDPAAPAPSWLKSLLFVTSEEHGLEPVPRRDGKRGSEFVTSDIGFYLPSNYYEREDGETPRSMAEPRKEWESAIEDMTRAIERLAEAELADAMLSDEVDSGTRQRAAHVFLSELADSRAAAFLSERKGSGVIG